MTLRSWLSFRTRRSLDIGLFTRNYGLDTKEKFLVKLASMGIDSPTENELVELFPPLKKEIMELSTEQVVETVGPVVETVEPVVETVGPVVETVGPVVETVGPVAETVGPVAETVGPVVENVETSFQTTTETSISNKEKFVKHIRKND